MTPLSMTAVHKYNIMNEEDISKLPIMKGRVIEDITIERGHKMVPAPGLRYMKQVVLTGEKTMTVKLKDDTLIKFQQFREGDTIWVTEYKTNGEIHHSHVEL